MNACAPIEPGCQDTDFQVLQIGLSFTISGLDSQGDPFNLQSGYDPAEWPENFVWAEDPAIAASVRQEATDAIAPWLSRFRSMGMIRGDGLWGWLDDPQFELVCRGDVTALRAELLADLPEVRVQLHSLPGAVLTLSAYTVPINATELFEAARQCTQAIGYWGGDATPDLLPAADEGRDAWLERITMPAERVSRYVQRWAASGRNLVIYNAYGDRSERENGDSEISWLVPERIERGTVTIVAGNGSAGKSSLVHSWLAALCGLDASSHSRTVLGHKIVGRFIGALISGEDQHGVINHREERHRTIWGGASYVVLNDPSKKLEYFLEQLRGMPEIDVLILDPLGSFYVGNEQSIDDMRMFLAPLYEFAREKNCAVIIVHHLTKAGDRVRSIAELRAFVRGAGNIITAPRMVIGVVRRSDGTVEVGPVKFNYPPDLVWLPMGKGIRYWPNPDTFTFDELPPTSNGPPTISEEATNSRVLAAVARCNRTGATVRKSGKYGLYECRLPELAGLSRAAILNSISELVSTGDLEDGEAGLLIAPIIPPAGEGAADAE